MYGCVYVCNVMYACMYALCAYRYVCNSCTYVCYIYLYIRNVMFACVYAMCVCNVMYLSNVCV